MPEAYREPVLGVHDLAPPEGRVTVQLLDARGNKIVKQEKQDNLILNSWQAGMQRMVRGDYQLNTGYNFAYSQEGSFGTTTTDTWFSGTSAWFPIFKLGSTYQKLLGPWSRQADCMRNIILSDSTVAVDADEWMFPGDITAFCYMPETYSGAHSKRAQLLLSACYRTPTAVRHVAEWGTTFGNGTINSIGIGHAMFPVYTSAPSTWYQCYACPGAAAVAASAGRIVASINNWQLYNSAGEAYTSAGQYFSVNQNMSGSDTPSFSGHRVSDNEYWTIQSGIAANQLTKWDLAASGTTLTPFTGNVLANGMVLAGPSMTTIGSNTSRTAVTVIGSDLWLAYGGTLKRCAKPTTTSLSVTNTYTPAGIETCVDIGTDGTDIYWLGATTVYQINATTGTVTSSWAHGRTGTMFNICYVGQPSSQAGLIISYMDSTLTQAVFNGPSTSNATNVHQTMRCDRFSLNGATRVPGWGINPTAAYAGGGSAGYLASGLIMPLTADCTHVVGFNMGNTSLSTMNRTMVTSPGHASRTVLGSPVVKTTSNSMRVIYEFGF